MLQKRVLLELRVGMHCTEYINKLYRHIFIYLMCTADISVKLHHEYETRQNNDFSFLILFSPSNADDFL
jgi:hypothetical protein